VPVKLYPIWADYTPDPSQRKLEKSELAFFYYPLANPSGSI
jgi:hypothetical protein